MNEVTDSLTVTVGPITAQADGPFAIMALLGIVIIYLIAWAVQEAFGRRVADRYPRS